MKSLEKYVVVDKEISGGSPVFKGTRVTVKTLFDYLEESSLEDFLKGHPSVSREQAEDGSPDRSRHAARTGPRPPDV